MALSLLPLACTQQREWVRSAAAARVSNSVAAVVAEQDRAHIEDAESTEEKCNNQELVHNRSLTSKGSECQAELAMSSQGGSRVTRPASRCPLRRPGRSNPPQAR